MEPILKAHFSKFKQAFEISTESKNAEEQQRKESDAFEKFVNYVLFSLDYPEIFTGDEELLDVTCLGGGHDTGIDGIGIKINDRLVRSVEDVAKIVDSSKKIDVEFVFIQSKMRPKFDSSDFNTFGIGIKHFFDNPLLPQNERLKEIREIKDYVYSNEKLISKLNTNPSISIFYVALGSAPTDDHFKATINFLQKELEEGNYYFENVFIKLIDGKNLISFCRELENNFSEQINILDIFPLIVDEKADVKKAYAFTCNASEFLKLISKREDETLRRSLFNDNVRDYLGSRGVINSEIEKTIIENPEMFLLCNNGITIVCSDFEQVRDKLVRIENPQIVNGCQTSNSIFNLRKHQNIGRIQLLIRLISTENLSVSNKIVRGTNKQNQVMDEAFEATLPFHQEVLEPFFLSFENDIKIFYERRSKQYNNDILIKKTQIVNLRILTQTFVGMFLSSPHNSHRHESKLIEEYAGEGDKRKIFREDHSPFPYYVCAATWYMFEKYFREGKVSNRYRPYKAQLLLIFKEILGESRPRLIKSKSLDAYCNKLLGLLKEPDFGIHIKKVIQVFDNAQKSWLDLGKSRFGIKDSKEFTELLVKESHRGEVNAKGITTNSEEVKELLDGQVLTILNGKNGWYGFISRGLNLENVYFDNRGYTDTIDKLLPKTKVKFELKKGINGYYSPNVMLVN
jgi:hypothetical protein